MFGGLTAENWLPGLTAAEASFFKHNGFLVKPGLLDPAQVAVARDRVYAAAPVSSPHPLTAQLCRDAAATTAPSAAYE